MSIRLACAQYACGQEPLKRSVRAVREACALGADLVVLPELAARGTSSVGEWEEAARELGIHIAGGVCEEWNGVRYNSAVLVGPEGTVGYYRKVHLWDLEKHEFTAGDRFPTFQTPLGRIGLLVCYDIWFPEAARSLALGGADLICAPAAAPDDWVPEAQKPGGLPMFGAHSISAANANRVFVAAANRVNDGYLGRSIIVDAGGGVLAFASPEKEAVIHADIDLARPRHEKRLTPDSHAFGDRNPGAYGRS